MLVTPGVRLVLFDLDGTLVDHQSAAAEGLERWLLGAGWATKDAIPALVARWEEVAEAHFPAYRTQRTTFSGQRRLRLRDFLPEVGIDPTSWSVDRLDEVFAAYDTEYGHAWRAFDDALPCLEALEGLTAVAVLPNGDQDQQQATVTVTICEGAGRGTGGGPRPVVAGCGAPERTRAREADGPPLPVTVHFHPDRLVSGTLLLEVLAREGVYRSQFETGTSTGGLTAHLGGDRWAWESRLFGGAYDFARAGQRPKYGSLNFRRRLTGGSPRFGSAHLRLRASVLERVTFCYPDSASEPTQMATATRMSLIEVAEADAQDQLDDYIEARVHGPLRLATDVEAVVLDPCYTGTEVERAARGLPCAVEWHPGFHVDAALLRAHPGYRGQRYVDLAVSLARGGHLDARALGDAARSGDHEEQDLKRAWHYIARFGAPSAAS